MSLAWRTRPPAATRRLLGLRAVADDYLVRDDGALVAVLVATAPSLALRGPDETDRLIETLRPGGAGVPPPGCR